MNTVFADPIVSASAWMMVKASVLIAVAAAVQATLRRRASAATRHVVWTLAIAALLLLPLASAVVPEWPVSIYRAAPSPQPVIDDPTPELVVRVTPSTAVSFDAAAPPAAAAGGVSWTFASAVAYLAVAIALLGRLMLQRWQVRRFAERATAVRSLEWTRLMSDCATCLDVARPVRVLRSREHSVPLAFGTLRPAVVVPAIADTWSDDRRRAVILHELAHVARHDCLTQTLAAVACAMYWAHPGVWWIAKRLRIERELACDDRVIAAGTAPRDYAGHLLDIAYSFGGHRAPALAVTMARPRQLEGRMLAALDAARNRRPPRARFRLAAAAAALLLLGPIAAARPTMAAVVVEAPLDDAAARWLSPQADSAPAPASGASAGAVDRRRKELTALAPGGLKDVVRLPLRGLSEIRDRFSRAVAAFAQEGGPGTWEIRPANDAEKGTVHLRLMERNSSSGMNVPIAILEGLTSPQLTGPGGPVQFRLRRDAGTFAFEGVIRSGVGAGTFTFVPDANFPSELEKRGFTRPTPGEQYQMARHDVGYAFLDELNRQGYAKPQTSELVRAGQHGVRTDYLRDMGALGYRLGSLEPLITLRDHGITPAYVRELADLGYKALPADDLRQARDHGITPDYVRGMRDGGYGSLPMKELINARDHGVSPDFVRALGEAGHRKLPVDQLLRVRDHGVTPEYVSEMRRLGYALAIDDLVRARDHGITVEYVKAMAGFGYAKGQIDALVRARDHGVTPDYPRDLKALGYDTLSLEDLVTLRDHGLTAERVRAANARAGTRLPIDMLKSLAAGGMR
jgi:beta-lactamase regulating signal transducer with metallopeptidase domain